MAEKRGIAAAIKLFGKTITLQREGGGAGDKPQGTAARPHEETADSREMNESSTHPSIVKEEDGSTKKSTFDEQSKEKIVTLKKPDKILPCPRCRSMDTKFCYYNNYNVNQPRHFCKNCQRYWTAGGTMRNVPVGAGRRKNKNPCQYRHISIPESALQALRFDEPSARYPCLTTNGTVLAFGSDTPLCNSASMISSKMEEASGVAPNQEANTQIPCFNGSTWPFPWNTPLPFCAPNVPIPVYPAAAYWSCAVEPGTWNTPRLSEPGKRVRDGEDGCRQVDPAKTFRIDDSEAAAKSSIWTMDRENITVNGGGLLKAFLPKDNIKNHAPEAPSLLHANPAALARSLHFQESS
ncbi:cyclic dof factor 1-like [Zingiber officinale]|uniref:Dof-type domain-containing protein n=1 Tax=Zingiber officinale TaxID=94328 RepID=A0A8J5K6P9_ZINOF|nr:cyclic dof factor 1-like [Zingiber officinale]KAG6475214.1 hypothetical protein ZIOFF_064432 [Zingiber officinale]